jgi:hypothetical protein
MESDGARLQRALERVSSTAERRAVGAEDALADVANR